MGVVVVVYGREYYNTYLVVPFELITQLVLLGESSICPGSPLMFHEVFSSLSRIILGAQYRPVELEKKGDTSGGAGDGSGP